MSIIETPWAGLLEDFVSTAKTDLMIATPFFSSVGLRKILEQNRRDIRIRLLLGKVTAQTMAEGSTDPLAIEEIFRQKPDVQCKCIENLHAKVLVADSLSEMPRAIITSSNLTREGLLSNIEFGIMIDGPLAKEIAERLTSYWNHPNAEPLSKEKFVTLSNESKKIERKAIPSGPIVSIGGHVHPEGIERIKLIIDELTVQNAIKELRRRHGYGYPEKRRGIQFAQGLLRKVMKGDLSRTEFERVLSIIKLLDGCHTF